MTVSSRPLAKIIRYPSPLCDDTNSATITPMMAKVMDTFIPSKIYGSACGSWIFQKNSQRLRANARPRSSISRLMLPRPETVLITIGKNAIRKAISTRDRSPRPNQSMSNGATAIFGTICAITSSGMIPRLPISVSETRIASRIPTRTASPKPRTVCIRVGQVCPQEELIASNEIVRDGGRARKDDFGYGKGEHGGLPCEQEQTEQSQRPERADPCSFVSPHGQRAGHQFEVDSAAAAIRHDGSSAGSDYGCGREAD